MQLCGLYSGTGAATLAIERSSVTKEHSVCRTTIHLVTRQNQDTRSLVRGQLLGTYRELTLGGYREPAAFPRYAAAMDSERSANAAVFRFQRPPYQAPRFSDYWLDGRDKGLFALDTGADPRYTYEGLRTVRALPQGEYSVLYSQFHHSLPCDESFAFFEEAWESTDTTEWVVNVTPPDG